MLHIHIYTEKRHIKNVKTNTSLSTFIIYVNRKTNKSMFLLKQHITVKQVHEFNEKQYFQIKK